MTMMCSHSMRSIYSAASSNSSVYPASVRSPETTTAAGFIRFISMIVLSRRSGTKRALPQWMSEIWHMVSRPFASMSCSGSLLTGYLSYRDIIASHVSGAPAVPTRGSTSPVALELGSEGRGVDVAQRPVPSPPGRQEVGLGAVEDYEGDRVSLDYVVTVERNVGEDGGRGLFGPGLVEQKVADAVVDRLPFVQLHSLGPVRVAADEDVGPCVDRGVREVHLLRLGGRHVLYAPVRHHDDEVDLGPQALYVLLHNTPNERRRARGSLRGPCPVVVGYAHVGEDAYLRSAEVEDHGFAGLREIHAGPGVQDVVVAEGDAVYASLVQLGHQSEVAREGRRVGVIDGVPYDGVLEVREREVGAGEVLPDRARVASAFGGELVDDPRLRVGALFGRAARDGRIAPVEREVYPHTPPDDHVVLPAVEHDVTAHDHAPQLPGVGNRRTFRLQGIVFRAGSVRVEERLAVYRQRLDPWSHLVPRNEPECPRSLAHVVDHGLRRIEALELRTVDQLAGLLARPPRYGQLSRLQEVFRAHVLHGRAEVDNGNEGRRRFGLSGTFRRFLRAFVFGAAGLLAVRGAGSVVPAGLPFRFLRGAGEE